MKDIKVKSGQVLTEVVKRSDDISLLSTHNKERVGKRAKVSFQDDCLVDSGNVKNKYLGDLAYDKYPTYKDVVMLSCK